MKKLRQVLYFSRARDGLDDGDVRQILGVSQRNNRKRDLTGCLLYSGRHFAQALEGDSKSLGDVLTRIHEDERHSDLVVAMDREVAIRKFPQWSMGILYKLEVAGLLETILSGKPITEGQALDVLDGMNPDTVMGAL